MSAHNWDFSFDWTTLKNHDEYTAMFVYEIGENNDNYRNINIILKAIRENMSTFNSIQKNKRKKTSL